MIQANELRIGNWVLNYGQYVCIEADDIVDCHHQPESYDPIPITHKILEKAGYKFIHLAGGCANESHFIELTETGCVFHPFCTSDDSCHLIIEFLHQLQNAEFMFTGEELQIDL